MKEIKLTKGKTAIIDDEDYDEISKYKWYLSKGKKDTYYAETKLSNGFHGLDNRRCNLRVCTNSENMGNCRQHKDSKTPKGIYWDKNRQKWAVQICCNYKKYTLGRFNDLEKAVLAYNIKAKNESLLTYGLSSENKGGFLK